MAVISKYLNKINKIVKKILDEEKKTECSYLIAFRGEPRDYGESRLKPSLFRKEFFLKREKTILSLLQDYGFLNKNESNLSKAINAQHYVEKSRFLDITFNALFAIYFACQKNYDYNDIDNGVVYIFKFPNFYSPNSPYIEDGYNFLFKNSNLSYRKNFKVLTHIECNRRISVQNGGVIFFPGDTFSQINDVYYEAVQIEPSDKENVLQELKNLFGIDQHYIYPDKDIKSFIENKLEIYSEDNKEFFMEEIKLFTKKMKYEIKMMEFKGYDKLKIARYIRKEINDFHLYFESVLKDASKYDFKHEYNFDRDLSEINLLLEGYK